MNNALTALRLQLLSNGWHILPNEGKACRRPDWNSQNFLENELNEAAIRRWSRSRTTTTTGLRVEGGLAVIDVDVDDAMAEELFRKIEQLAPAIAAAPMRYGHSQYKFALFCRLKPGEQDFARWASPRYFTPAQVAARGAGEEVDGHIVEVFGGKPTADGRCSRQFAIYGPHPSGGEYAWAEGVELKDVRLSELPEIDRHTIGRILDAFKALALAAGWAEVEAEREGGGEDVYDITDTTIFDVQGGASLRYEELEDGMRCSSSFFDPHSGGNRSKCWTFVSARHGDSLGVYDHKTLTSHYHERYRPVDRLDLDPVLAELGEASEAEAEAEAEAEPPRPSEQATMADKARWLLQTRGYCELTDRVVEIYKANDECQTRRIAFQFAFRAWHETVTGKKGGKKQVYATSWWELAPTRRILEGVRLRPDRPFPCYQEDGRWFKNTYQRLRHAGSGSIEVWLRFMQHLLPDPIERNWFCDWLAHKHRNPAIPGVAVIMVAADDGGPVYGAGRGMLRDILAALFGRRYVRTIDFDVFTGQSSQGVYTDWAAYSLLVAVNEAKDTPDSGRWSDRRAVYERIKEIVDPRPVERMFTAKGMPSFIGLAFASYLIFSNNRDALQLPPGDRRATALRNGSSLSTEQAVELDAWMRQEGNIAALAAWLEARDISAFNAYQPLETSTKAVMQELARTDIEEAFDRARAAIGPGGLFTGDMLLSEIRDEVGGYGGLSDGQEAQVKRMIKSASRKVDGLRLTPKQGRHWILTWRDNPTLAGLPEERARIMVEATKEKLRAHFEDNSEVRKVLIFPDKL